MNLPMKRILAICLSSLIPFFAIASDGGEGDAVEGPVSSVLDNGLVSRTFSWEDGHFTTSSYRISGYDREFVDRVNEEFSFLVNDMPFSGRSSWEVTPETLQGEGGSRIFRVTLDSRELQGLEVQVTYTVYLDIPLVKKQMAFRNSGVKNMRLESLDVENLQMQGFADNWVMRYYGRYRHVGPYVGDWDDPVIVLHDLFNDRGIALGNEAPGVTKRSSALLDGRSMTAGLRHKDQAYPFRKWLAPGESWEAPAVFSALYSGTPDPYEVLNTSVSDYVRKYMGTRFEQLEEKPLFVYNTWFPFYTKIDHDLLMEVADAAAECGVEEFIVDDGWQVCHGDWQVDTVKFPGGLKPLFDHIKSLGMRPGLWTTVSMAMDRSEVFKEHPEWFVRDVNGDLCNLHTENPSDGKTACMASGWKDHIKSVVLRLVKDYGLAYSKLDFAIATSAYVFDSMRTGCWAGDHPGHKDHEESYMAIYEECLKLFDELHAEAPDLFIDCTYETAGKWHLIDYGIVKHAEGDWLSNIQQPGALGAFRARLLAWQRTPAIPASTLVMGNLRIDDPEYELAFKSLCGALPVMLGDPRQLSAAQRKNLKDWSTWLGGLQQRHGYMSFRQDLPGYGEPQEGCWDGFARINTDTRSGGLVGIFRQGSPESRRTVTVKYLDPDADYLVREGKTGRVVARATGRELETSGFTVYLSRKYDGQLFEIVRCRSHAGTTVR